MAKPADPTPTSPHSTPALLPLSGLTVLDLTLARAGPTCVRHLADWGANVIRIEPPATVGENLGGNRHGSDFQNLHRNKRAIQLNLKDPEGHAVFMRMVAKADVIVENMRADVKHRLKIAWDDVRAVNPRIVYGSISGFGQTGPYAPRPGYDSLIQGMGGVMSLTGEPEGLPQKVGVPVADLFAGLYGCIGILAALRHRDLTGQGQQIDIGMLDTHVAWLANQGMNYLATGENPARLGNQHPNIVPYQVFPTEDGYMVLSVGNDPTFKRFCEAFELTHLLADERFATNAARVANRQFVTDTLTPVMKTHPTTWWVDRLEELKIGCGPINTLKQVFADPHVQARGVVVEMPHASLPQGGTVKVIANPVRLSETPADYRLPPPVLGQHTDEVLKQALGLDDGRLAELRGKGVI